MVNVYANKDKELKDRVFAKPLSGSCNEENWPSVEAVLNKINK